MIEKIIDKISSYQFFNFFYPGAIFLGVLDCLMKANIMQYSVGYLLLFSYFLGMVFSRVGSLLLEYLMLKLHAIEQIKYSSLVKAESKDSKVMLLLEVCNTFRTLSATFLVLTLLMLSKCCLQIELNVTNKLIGGCFFLFVLFLVSFCKQYNYVRKRIDTIIEFD